MKICAYIAGDKNIINPAIVCLSSVKKYNNSISLFIFSELHLITNEQIMLCNKYGINIIDINDIDNKYIPDNIPEFCQTLYNYLAPSFLYTQGYDFAIKLDYDMLCIDSFIMSDILPEKEQGICVLSDEKVESCIDKYSFEQLKEKFNIDRYRAVNVGFIVFDLKYFSQKNIASIYKDILLYISSKKIIIHGETYEQF